LDEVGKRQALVLVAPGVGGDQPQVGVEELFLGVQIAALDFVGGAQHDVELLLRSKESQIGSEWFRL
jgi:hypothetical protein